MNCVIANLTQYCTSVLHMGPNSFSGLLAERVSKRRFHCYVHYTVLGFDVGCADITVKNANGCL